MGKKLLVIVPETVLHVVASQWLKMESHKMRPVVISKCDLNVDLKKRNSESERNKLLLRNPLLRLRRTGRYARKKY